MCGMAPYYSPALGVCFLTVSVSYFNTFLVSILLLNHVALHLSIVLVLKPEFVSTTY